jgi:hypothetical protein
MLADLVKVLVHLVDLGLGHLGNELLYHGCELGLVHSSILILGMSVE